MQKYLRPTLFVTAYSFIGMIVGFIIQTVTAIYYGASSELDAYLAAFTLPQYVISVITGSLVVVFIPVFVDYLSKEKIDQAWQIASSVLNITVLLSLLVSLVAILFTKFLVQIAFPGLSVAEISLASDLARILWPSIVFSSWISLLTGMYQVRENFVWPTLVNVIGLLITLFFLRAFGGSFGIAALAWSTVIGLCAQAFLLTPILLKSSQYKLILGWNLPGVVQIWSLLWPLLLSGFFIRATIVVDRFVSSSLPSGSISHLSYASKILGVISMLISAGVSTVLFPRMANSVSLNDLDQLKETLSKALRLIWLVVAPTMVLTVMLSLPVVTILFQRGAFTIKDSHTVAFLLSWYALAMVGISFGAMTGRVFYVLQDTRTLSVMGVLEMLAYILYTPMLANWYGTVGVVIAYCIYFTASLAWQVYYIWGKLGRTRPKKLVISFSRTLFSALLSGIVIWILSLTISDNLSKVLISSLGGACIYILMLKVVGSRELNKLIEVVNTVMVRRREKPL